MAGSMPMQFTQNRELSWLRFNERVLDEGADETVPLLERLKFIAIFNNNLDEFFMIRVGSQSVLAEFAPKMIDNKSGMTIIEQLQKIYSATSRLYEKKDKIYNEVEKHLKTKGVSNLTFKDLTNEDQKYIKQFFKSTVLPILSPQIIDEHHPFPHIPNKIIQIICVLKKGKTENLFGIIPIPATLPEVVFLPGDSIRYIAIEKIVLEYTQDIFNMYNVTEKTTLCITRNADIHPEDEIFAEADTNHNGKSIDFRQKMKKALQKRRRLAVVRVETANPFSEKFDDFLRAKFEIQKNQIFVTKSPLKMGYAFSLFNKLSAYQKENLTFPGFKPMPSASVVVGESMFKQIQRHDILLSYPYESIDPFLQLMKEAATDPDVLSIKITIYRLASKAKLVDYLCSAAENGKDVVVIIELRARFDELDNIDWSERLESAGCTLIYGFEQYKVHSKICLITRKDRGGIHYITNVATGNYNEKTAELYTDLSLLTANQRIGSDADVFFKNMAMGNLEGTYNHLLVAPNQLKNSLCDLIDEQTAQGEKGEIFIKINSITDMDLMNKISQASCAGVKIRMIIRGITCILPNIPMRTENLAVRSVVGQFLEHARIYCFGSGTEKKIYIASADMMTRNTIRRVEVACPIYDEKIKNRITSMLQIMWADNVKSRIMTTDGTYIKHTNIQEPINSQAHFIQEAIEKAQKPLEDTKEEPFLKRIFHNFFTQT